MKFIHNGVEVERPDNILLEKWQYPFVTGDAEIPKPQMVLFNNIVLGIKMLNKHITNKSRIGLHIDVDVDGFGTGYIEKRVLGMLGIECKWLIINNDKIHGVEPKHALFFDGSTPERTLDLIIISDSSSNEIETIKNFKCDVLVVDHHELLHNDLSGKCNDGIHDYVIINNTIDNYNFNEDKEWLNSRTAGAFENITEYKGDSRMSCGLVFYEIWRVYLTCFGVPSILEDNLLYQWVTVTLFTDVIQTLTPRNQWYIANTVNSLNEEPVLSKIQEVLTTRYFNGKPTRWRYTLDKTYINYTFAPVINKAIRYGYDSEAKSNAGSIALGIVLTNPSAIAELNKYSQKQVDAVNSILYTNYNNIENLIAQEMSKGLSRENAITSLKSKGISLDLIKKDFQDNVLINITDTGISPNYTGAIGGRVSDSKRNVAVYRINEKGLAKGSFRGRNKYAKYRDYFQSFNIYAQGHPGAFGFELPEELLKEIMINIDSLEEDTDTREFLSVGEMPDEEKGVYHIQSMNDFKANGYLLRLAYGNSRVNSFDEIYIKVPARDVVLESVKGKLYLYKVYGITFKAFKELHGDYFKLYIEYTKEPEYYIKDI